MKMSRGITTIIIAALALSFAQAQELTIGVNYISTSNGGWQQLNEDIIGGETVPLADGEDNDYWNNIPLDITTNEASLLWSDGSFSSVDVTVTGGGTVFEWGNSQFKQSYFRAGVAGFAGSIGNGCTFSNLNVNFPNGYRAIVYVTGASAGAFPTATPITCGISNSTDSVLYYFTTAHTNILFEITDTNTTSSANNMPTILP